MWKILMRGFASIAESMSTFSLFSPPHQPYKFEIDRRSDAEKMHGDWEKVIGKF
jgi:hypothetical protein